MVNVRFSMCSGWHSSLTDLSGFLHTPRLSLRVPCFASFLIQFPIPTSSPRTQTTDANHESCLPLSSESS
jgi:hypothetical protein